MLLTAQFGAPMTTGRAELGGDGNGLRYTGEKTQIVHRACAWMCLPVIEG